MDKAATEEKAYAIKITLQGACNCICIGKGVIRALGVPGHVSLKISDNHDSLSIFPCDEDDVMAFCVPAKLLTDRHCVMRINSKRFVHGVMSSNNMDTTRTYPISGEYIREKNIAVFPLVKGATHRD